MRFTAYDKLQKEISSKVYYSVGGGFIVDYDMAEKRCTFG